MKSLAIALALPFVVAGTAQAVTFIPLEYQIYIDTGTGPGGTSSETPSTLTLGSGWHTEFRNLNHQGVFSYRDNALGHSGMRIHQIFGSVLNDRSGAFGLAYRFRASGTGQVVANWDIISLEGPSDIATVYNVYIKDLTDNVFHLNTSSRSSFTGTLGLIDGHDYEVYTRHDGSNVGFGNDDFRGDTLIVLGEPVPEPGSLLAVLGGFLGLARRRRARA